MITKLSDTPEEYKEAVNAYLENLYQRGSLVRPADKYDYTGLRFNIHYLNALETRIIFYPVEIMAEYVDIVTKSHMDTPIHSRTRKSFEMQVIDDIDFFSTQEIVETINATGIGNYAYVYLHTQNNKLKTKLERVLNEIYRYSFNKYKDELEASMESEIQFIIDSLNVSEEEKEVLKIELRQDYEKKRKQILAQETE